jgi:methylglyoxal synthase
MRPRIALIAHDKKKDDMIALAGEYLDFLRGCTLSATGTTGGRLVKNSAWKSCACTPARSAATCRSAPSW